ncbi:hypothetical protein JCM3766R1_003720 [Sporobolomyces carnicolor]
MTRQRLGTHPLWLAIATTSIVSALVIQNPDNATVWDRSGNTRTFIRWALDPPTDPPPRTNLMTIWLRNGAPDMYDPPLNLTLARHVDFVAKTQVEVQDVIDFLPGTGYQLFLADPENATMVYCESPVFDIDDDPHAAYERKLTETVDPTSTPLPTSSSAPLRIITSDPPEPVPATLTTTAEPEEATPPPSEPEPAEEPSAPSSWLSSITSIFTSSSESPLPPPEDTSRPPIVIVRPSPPPVRGEENVATSSEAPAPPSSSEDRAPPPSSSSPDDLPPATVEEAPATSTSITPPPPASSSPPPPPPPPPPPAASSIDSSSSSASSSRDFYWYYSVSPSASSVAPTSTVEAAKAVATVDLNAPCTCGGGAGGNLANSGSTVRSVDTGSGTAFQIIIRPIPGSHGDQGVQLFTAGADRASSSVISAVAIVLGSFFVLL